MIQPKVTRVAHLAPDQDLRIVTLYTEYQIEKGRNRLGIYHYQRH